MCTLGNNKKEIVSFSLIKSTDDNHLWNSLENTLK